GELLARGGVAGVVGGEQRAQLGGGVSVGVLGEPRLGELAVRSGLRHGRSVQRRARRGCAARRYGALAPRASRLVARSSAASAPRRRVSTLSAHAVRFAVELTMWSSRLHHGRRSTSGRSPGTPSSGWTTSARLRSAAYSRSASSLAFSTSSTIRSRCSSARD